MYFEIPKSFRPVLDFVIHVVVGSVGFVVLFSVSALISVFVRALDGVVPRWFEAWAEYAEMGLLALDMVLFALFSIAEAVKLIRGLWMEWRS